MSMKLGPDQLDVLDPDPSVIRIEDVALRLSRLHRFAGASALTVAQHSVAVSLDVPDRLALAGLMHDAHESYVADIPKPVKVAIRSRRLEAICDDLDRAIWKAIGRGLWRPAELHDARVKAADDRATHQESYSMLGWELPEGVEPEPLRALAPKAAERLFLERWSELTTGESA